ncbi:hypothetical protein [Streptomyces sp. NPDC004629]|uniref:hypothetical protein n=1 Tax=Streptomyces sp. NPDC004629 TaxID=3364705 RepID=UPI003696B448
MSKAKVSTSELVTHYSSQLNNDLERNKQEQDQIRREMEEMQERLLSLQHDYAVLATMQHALKSGIPLQQVSASLADADLRADLKYSPPSASASASASAGALRRKQTKPTLVGLIRAYLAEQSEPCSAAEVTTALSAAHPDRAFKTTVVRTTLEGLVARSNAERIKQGHAVFYVRSDGGQDQEASECGAS